jgi:hypothetical protein
VEAAAGSLIDEDSLELYISHYLLNPPESRGFSLTEIEAMPESRRRDFMFLRGEMARIRKSVRRKNEADKKVKDGMQAKRTGGKKGRR